MLNVKCHMSRDNLYRMIHSINRSDEYKTSFWTPSIVGNKQRGIKFKLVFCVPFGVFQCKYNMIQTRHNEKQNGHIKAKLFYFQQPIVC